MSYKALRGLQKHIEGQVLDKMSPEEISDVFEKLHGDNDRLRAELEERQRHTLNEAMADDVLSFCATRNLYRDTLNGAVGAVLSQALGQERELEQERVRARGLPVAGEGTIGQTYGDCK